MMDVSGTFTCGILAWEFGPAPCHLTAMAAMGQDFGYGTLEIAVHENGGAHSNCGCLTKSIYHDSS